MFLARYIGKTLTGAIIIPYNASMAVKTPKSSISRELETYFLKRIFKIVVTATKEKKNAECFSTPSDLLFRIL